MGTGCAAVGVHVLIIIRDMMGPDLSSLIVSGGVVTVSSADSVVSC